jgi:DNA-binding NarL/FixJ family response regulator
VSEAGRLTVALGVLDPRANGDLAQALAGAGLAVIATNLASDAVAIVVVKQRPHVLVVGEATDYSLLARLKAEVPGTRILAVAHQPSRLSGTTLLAAGVACVAQGTSTADLVAAIDLVARGGVLYIAASGERIERPAVSTAVELTRREREVFNHLRAGRSYAEIALELCIGYETVRTHASRVRKKLGVRSTQELAGKEHPGTHEPTHVDNSRT